MSNIKVSIQAFLQQIQNWNMTLFRQSKKLKSIKPQIKNKFKLNSIQIVLTEIQSIQIKYKKVKNKYESYLNNQNKQPNFVQQKNLSEQILTQYSVFSKIFMDILQKISLIEEETNEQNMLINQIGQNDNQNAKNKSFISKNQQKSFLNQTFAYKVSKQSKQKGNKSLFQQRKSQKTKQQSKPKNVTRNKAFSISTNNYHDINNLSLINNSKNTNVSKLKIQNNRSSIKTIDQQEDSNLWEIRHQLNQIKSMMKEMKNQIKYHQHEETTREINKIQTKNRKIASELKSIRQQNRFILQKMDDFKKQLMQQKKAQVQMINRFQKKSTSSIINYAGLQDSRATHGEVYRSIRADKSPIHSKTQQKQQNVSDWVKIRI